VALLIEEELDEVEVFVEDLEVEEAASEVAVKIGTHPLLT
jgi:hypothetical protein